VRPTRGSRVPRPADDPWVLRFADLRAVKGWSAIKAQSRSNLTRAWDELTADPRRVDQRQHQLKGSLATGTLDGRALEQWQYEVTGAGRLRYLVDDETHEVWIVSASPGHPRDTE
jgi:hypothetical protein